MLWICVRDRDADLNEFFHPKLGALVAAFETFVLAELLTSLEIELFLQTHGDTVGNGFFLHADHQKAFA